MLKKLIGYEFRATRRVFLPAYLILLALSALNAISFVVTWNLETLTLPSGLLFTAYVAVIMVVVGLSVAYMIYRCYRNMLGDEGYLMFTLPVQPAQLLWAKAITSMIWILCTGIVCCISGFIVIGPMMADNFNLFDAIQNLSMEAVAAFGSSVWLVPLEVLLACIGAILAFCMQVYAALSLGQLAHRWRLGISFAAYIIFCIAEQFVLSLLARSPLSQIFFTYNTGIINMHISIAAFLVWSVVEILVFFNVANYLLKNKLNLQ
jgi:hypothetical protein